MSMTAAFSEWAIANLPSVDWTTPDPDLRIRLTVLVRSAFLAEQDDYMSSIPQATLTELLESPGWQAVSGTQANTAVDGDTAAATSITAGSVREIGGTLGFSYASEAPVFATAFALSIDRAAPDDNLICVFQPPYPVYLTGDPDDNLNWSKIKPPDTGDGTYLFSYLSVLEDGSCNPQLGSISLSVPTLDWEDSRAAHVWLDPQRINYAVNPSMEASGAGVIPYGWRSNATMSKERGGINPPQGMTPQSRQFAARLTGAEDPKVLESSMFPAGKISPWWSIEAAVSGQGLARIGILFWTPNLLPEDTTYVTTGWFDLQSSFEYAAPPDPEDEVINQGEFRVIKALIPEPENAHQALFRLEFQGAGDVWVDNVLVEPNEAQLGYFDGEWEFGQVGDYSWYTGTGVQDVNDPHKTFSLFYNNRKAIRSVMVDPIPPGAPVPQHHVLSWVPEGASVVVHWDDAFTNRLHSWIDDIYIPTPDYPDPTVVTTVGETLSTLNED